MELHPRKLLPRTVRETKHCSSCSLKQRTLRPDRRAARAVARLSYDFFVALPAGTPHRGVRPFLRVYGLPHELPVSVLFRVGSVEKPTKRAGTGIEHGSRDSESNALEHSAVVAWALLLRLGFPRGMYARLPLLVRSSFAVHLRPDREGAQAVARLSCEIGRRGKLGL